MRTFIIILVVLALLVVGLVFYDRFLSAVADEMLQFTEKVRDAVLSEDWEAAEAAMRRLSAAWENNTGKLAAVTEHEELDNLMLHVASAEAFLSFREKPELVAELSELSKLFDHIPQKEKPTFCNIF